MKYLFVSVMSLFLCMGMVFSQNFPAYDGAVTDLAGVLTAQEEALLETQIQQVRDATTVEAAVLFLPTTGEYEIADYTIGLGNHWGVGKFDNDNGIVMVVAVDDRKWFTATGYGVEGALPDILVDRISEKHLPTAFRAGDYSGGVSQVLSEFKKILEGDESVRSSYSNQPLVLKNWQLWLIHIGMTLLLYFLVSIFQKDKAQGLVNAWFFGFAAWHALIPAGSIFGIYIVVWLFFLFIRSGSTGSSGSWGSGGGWSSGGGGGFSGFSGGSFGGGGSGGSW